MYIAIQRENTFTVQKQYTEDAVDKIWTANNILNNINDWNHLYYLYSNAHQCFKNFVMEQEKSIDRIDILQLSNRINELLSAGYKYLETTKKFYINKFSNTEIDLDKKEKTIGEIKYNQFTKRIYDNSFSYRFIHNIRNCFQHVGEGGLYLNISSDGLNVIIKKREYSDFHKGIQASFKKELNCREEEEFNLFNLIDNYLNDIRVLNDMMSHYIIDSLNYDLFKAGMQILTVLDLDIEGKYVFYDSKKTLTGVTFDTQVINVPFARNFVELHCKFFKMHGNVIGIDDNNKFPQYTNGENKILSGSEIVNDKEVTWKKQYELSSDEFGDYIAIYVPLFFSDEERSKICEIAKGCLNT